MHTILPFNTFLHTKFMASEKHSYTYNVHYWLAYAMQYSMGQNQNKLTSYKLTTLHFIIIIKPMFQLNSLPPYLTLIAPSNGQQK